MLTWIQRWSQTAECCTNLHFACQPTPTSPRPNVTTSRASTRVSFQRGLIQPLSVSNLASKPVRVIQNSPCRSPRSGNISPMVSRGGLLLTAATTTNSAICSTTTTPSQSSVTENLVIPNLVAGLCPAARSGQGREICTKLLF